MIPAAFDYHSPQTLEEALALLQSHRDDAKVLSGGQSLLPLLKLRLGAAGHLVDIGRIPGLEYIKEEGGVLKIGGRTRESALEHSELIQTKYPDAGPTAAVIADPLVRNLATVGGNLAHGDPANDHPATMLALRRRGGGDRTQWHAHHPDRSVLPRPLHHGAGVGRDPDRDPHPGAASCVAAARTSSWSARSGDFATAAAAVQLTLGAGGEVTSVGIALTNAGPTPSSATDAEQYPHRQTAERRRDRGSGAARGDGRLAQRRPARGQSNTSGRWRASSPAARSDEGHSAGRRSMSHGASTRSRSRSTALITRRRSSRASCSSTFCARTLRLTGTHIGCDTTHCGACTVLLDGEPVKSCTVLAVQADGRDGHHGRGPGAGRQAPPDPGRLLAGARPPVRLLHAGHDDDQRCAARRRTPIPAKGEIRQRDLRQPLPVHRLRQHRQIRAVRRRQAATRHGNGSEMEASHGTPNFSSRLRHGPLDEAQGGPALHPRPGHYVDDIKLPGMLYMDIVRSPYAHAKIKKPSTPRRRSKMPGVLAVITGETLEAVQPALDADADVGHPDGAARPKR